MANERDGETIVKRVAGRSSVGFSRCPPRGTGNCKRRSHRIASIELPTRLFRTIVLWSASYVCVWFFRILRPAPTRNAMHEECGLSMNICAALHARLWRVCRREGSLKARRLRFVSVQALGSAVVLPYVTRGFLMLAMRGVAMEGFFSCFYL